VQALALTYYQAAAIAAPRQLEFLQMAENNRQSLSKASLPFALFAISKFSLGLLFAESDFITFYLQFTPANIQCSRHPPSMIFVVSASSNKRNSIAVNRISPE
jgi:hypothetical protein